MKDKDAKLLEEAYERVGEGLASDVGHTVLDLAGLGFDLVGGHGVWFDAANAVWYASEKNFLYAALSLISAIPLIGDVVGKGGKLLHKMEGARRAGASMYKSGKVMKSSKTAAQLTKVKQILKSPDTVKKVNAIFDKAAENPKLAPHVDEMKTALQDFANQPVVDSGSSSEDTQQLRPQDKRI
jgi:hypothetical protein